LRAVLEGKVFQPSQTYELQCIGIVLGDVLASQLGLFPLTMISKCIERGEEVDVFDLFNAVADDVEKLKADLG
jgi:hypothetical protein